MSKKYASFEEFKKDFEKNINKIKKELGEAIPEVGQMMMDDIKKRTRLGYGVKDNDTSKNKLDPLSPDYVKQRKRLKKRGKLSSDTTPAKSNLTKSGSMLDNLDAKSNKTKFTVNVKPIGIDRDGVSNAKKAEYVSKARPFLYLSKPEIKRIREFLSKELDKIIDKLF